MKRNYKNLAFVFFALTSFGLFAKICGRCPCAARRMRKAANAVAETDSYRDISPSELSNWVSSGKKMHIINVLSNRSFESVHIDGSKNIPLASLRKELENYDKENDVIVFYCLSGFTSSSACRIACELGFKNVFNLSTGMKGWVSDGYKLQGRSGEISTMKGLMSAIS